MKKLYKICSSVGCRDNQFMTRTIHEYDVVKETKSNIIIQFESCTKRIKHEEIGNLFTLYTKSHNLIGFQMWINEDMYEQVDLYFEELKNKIIETWEEVNDCLQNMKRNIDHSE